MNPTMKCVQTPAGRAERGAQAQRRGRRCRGDEGAVLVEFAIIMPLLFLLIFGIIEFGWTFFQLNNTRHGAREGVRVAAVYQDPGGPGATVGDRIAAETCRRMSSGANGSTVTVQFINSVAPDSIDVGDEVRVRVVKQLQTITGFFGPLLSSVIFDESVISRMEQPGPSVAVTYTKVCT